MLWWRLHRSLAVSISPNNSLLPPLLTLPNEVADAADETVENEEDGLWCRTGADGLRCLRLMIWLMVKYRLINVKWRIS